MEIFKKISQLTKKAYISPDILLSKFCVANENVRQSIDYNDPRYFPLYFYLGRELKPKSLIEIGFGNGMISGCLLRGSRSVEDFFAFELKKEGYSPKIGRKNIRKVYNKNFYLYIGTIYDQEFKDQLNVRKWDIGLVNVSGNYDENMSYFNILWDNLVLDGLMVIDNLDGNAHLKKAFNDFCKIKNIEPVLFKTRRGLGVIKR